MGRKSVAEVVSYTLRWNCGAILVVSKGSDFSNLLLCGHVEASIRQLCVALTAHASACSIFKYVYYHPIP